MPIITKRYCLPKLRTFIDEKGFGVGSFIDESKQPILFKSSASLDIAKRNETLYRCL